jgi:hypothetical protein
MPVRRAKAAWGPVAGSVFLALSEGNASVAPRKGDGSDQHFTVHRPSVHTTIAARDAINPVDDIM